MRRRAPVRPVHGARAVRAGARLLRAGTGGRRSRRRFLHERQRRARVRRTARVPVRPLAGRGRRSRGRHVPDHRGRGARRPVGTRRPRLASALSADVVGQGPLHDLRTVPGKTGVAGGDARRVQRSGGLDQRHPRSAVRSRRRPRCHLRERAARRLRGASPRLGCRHRPLVRVGRGAGGRRLPMGTRRPRI